MAHHCKKCLKKLRHEDINIHTMFAKCSNCHAVFSLQEILREAISHAPRKPTLLLPERFEELSLNSSYSVTYKWFSKKVYFLIPFALFWNGIVLTMAFGAASDFPIALVFMSFHILIGLGLVYFIILNIFNSTTVHVDHRNIDIEHFPLPPLFFKNSTTPVHQIQQLFVTEVKKRHKNGQQNITYNLNYRNHSGHQQKLLKYIPTYEYARYLEQKIEAFLDIEDKMVSEEVVK